MRHRARAHNLVEMGLLASLPVTPADSPLGAQTNNLEDLMSPEAVASTLQHVVHLRLADRHRGALTAVLDDRGLTAAAEAMRALLVEEERRIETRTERRSARSSRKKRGRK